MQRTGDRSANALKGELVVRVEASSTATPETVYGLLADLSSHLVWAGERQSKKTRLLTIEAPAGPAVVGTEWRSTGSDPMGTFSDRSVVTEATPGKAFEFVTEAHLTTTKRRSSTWTGVERYGLEPVAGGSRIVSTSRITRISELPGMVAIFNVPVLRELGLKASARVSRRTVRNLARLAEEREGEVSRMRKLRLFVALAVLVALPAAPAAAASPAASCPGQELSTLGPVLGSDLGAFIAFEAQDPELEGRKSFGEEVSAFAHADRTACPEE